MFCNDLGRILSRISDLCLEGHTFLSEMHALNADAHLSAALLCYFRCNWSRNLGAVCLLYSIVLTLSTLQMVITLVIVVALYCYGYNTITKCP